MINLEFQNIIINLLKGGIIMKKNKLLLFGIIALILVIAIILIINNKKGINTNAELKQITFEDLKNGKIGIMIGSVAENIAIEKFPNAEIVYFNENMDAVAALKAGQIDGVITSYPTVFYCAKYNDDLTYIDEPLSSDISGVAVKKGEEELLKEIDDFITSLKEDGTLEDMESRWFNLESQQYNEPNITEITEGTPLVVGVAANREPVCFLNENGIVSGLDGELARRIGEHLNRPVEFVDMKFSSLIPALESGKVDVVISNVAITEERKKSVNFTQEYFASPQMMIVRKVK